MRPRLLPLLLVTASACAAPTPWQLSLEGVECSGPEYEGTFSPVRAGELRSFCTTWTRIDGDLVVHETDLQSLEGLECLCEVSGDVEIVSNQQLETLTGLRLQKVGGRVQIGALFRYAGDSYNWTSRPNPILSELGALSALEAAGAVAVEGGTARVLPLPNLSQVDRLTVIDMPDLSRIDLPEAAELDSLTLFSLPELDSVVLSDDLDSLRSWPGLWLLETGMAGLDDFAGLVSVYNLWLVRNPELQTTSGLASLQELGGTVSVWNNAELRDVAAVEEITDVPGWLFVGGNPWLLDSSGLAAIQSVGENVIIGNADLARYGQEPIANPTHDSTLTSLDLLSLESVGGSLFVGQNSGLADLDGLAALRTVGQHLVVEANPDLFDISGLGGVESIGGAFDVLENPELPTSNVAAVIAAIGVANIGEGFRNEGNAPQR